MCHEYIVDNHGKVITKFQFSSLFNKAWFLAIQPHTIVSGFGKVGVYPFDSTAIKSYDTAAVHNETQVMAQPNESL